MKHLLFFISLLLCGQAFSQDILWERRWRAEGFSQSVYNLIIRKSDTSFIVNGTYTTELAYPGHVSLYDLDGVQL